MPIARREAEIIWEGPLARGTGTLTSGSGALDELAVTWASRTEQPDGRTSPEELIAAAHSSCFSMALSNALAKAGSPPELLKTTAAVTFQPGEGITGIHLTVVGSVEGVSAEDFAAAAEDAKKNCPVSQALTGTTITLDATLS